MDNSKRTLICWFTAMILLVTTSGCDWMFPLTSPRRATVDKRLLGYWKAEEPEADGFEIIAFSECAKAGLSLGGAMFMKPLRLNRVSFSQDVVVCWPTRIGNESYLNVGVYDIEAEKLQTGSKAFFIYKYEITGDSCTVHSLNSDQKKRINSSLGSSYNAADLLQEISKATEWKKMATLSRIR